MTEERRNPLPAGRYWLFVSEPNRIAFETWRTVNAASVKVEVTESETNTDPPTEFFIFNTVESVPVPGGTGTIAVPLEWDAKAFGFPSIAGPDVHSSADVTRAPPLPKDATDQISDALDEVGSFGKAVGVGLFAVGAVWLIGKFLEGRKGKPA